MKQEYKIGKIINQQDYYTIQNFTRDNALMIANTFMNNCYVCIKDNKVFGIYPKDKYSLESVKEDLKEFDSSEYTIIAPSIKLNMELYEQIKNKNNVIFL